MEQNKLTITPKNYLGYTELYKAKNYLNDKEKEEILKKYGLCACALFIFSFPLIVITGLFYSVLFCSGASVLFIIPIQHKITKKKVKQVVHDFPYVNAKVSNIVLFNALEGVGIITNSKVDVFFTEQVDTYDYERAIRLSQLRGENIKVDGTDAEISYSTFSQNKRNCAKVKKLVKNGRR